MKPSVNNRMRSQKFLIGLDVGGTNVDAVLLDAENKKLIAATKYPSTRDIREGIRQVFRVLAAKVETKEEEGIPNVKGVFIGTTAFINALLEGRGMAKVGCVRLGHCGRELPPGILMPPSLRKVILEHDNKVNVWQIDGGHNYDGSALRDLDYKQVDRVVTDVRSRGIDALVVSAIFSPVAPEQEEEVCQYIQKKLPHVNCFASTHIGRLGILYRENSAILNAALLPMAKRTIGGILQAVHEMIPSDVPVLLTTNDGAALPVAEAVKWPVMCMASGPTNSLKGAAFLSNRANCMVLDIGGTSSDVGVVLEGRPRISNIHAEFANVPMNHRVCDVACIALGGGTVVHANGSVGPESVGARLFEEALAYGGSTCTTTDIALAKSSSTLYDRSEVKEQPPSELASKAWDVMQEKLDILIDSMRPSKDRCTVIVVGGGSNLVDVERLEKRNLEVLTVEHGEVANAYGAALAGISATVEVILDLSKNDIDKVTQEALNKAAEIGATNPHIVSIDKVPLAYLPGKVTRVTALAVGAANFDKLKDSNFNLRLDEDDIILSEDTAERVDDSYTALPIGRWPEAMNSPLQSLDVECIALGCGVLGCGGGGSTSTARVRLLERLKRGEEVRIVSPNDLPNDAVVVCGGNMGAPTVSLERLFDTELVAAAMMGHQKKPTHVMALEIGGANGMEGLLCGAHLGLPVVDADLMGRAFPELQMVSLTVKGIPLTPAVLADYNGSTLLATQKRKDKKWLEQVMRPVCSLWGCCATLALRPLSASEVRECTITGTVSLAWSIGKAILMARQNHDDPAESVAHALDGKVIGRGKIVDVQRDTSAGFARGSITILMRDQTTLMVSFQNELLQVTGDLSSATIFEVPDLLTLLDVDTGTPIATEEMNYGQRVSLLWLPSNPLFTTPEGLAVVGPKAFNL